MKFCLNISLVCLLMAATVSCKKVSSAEDVDKIKALEAEITALEENRNKPDWQKEYTAKCTELRDKYLDFVKTYPESPDAPDYLYIAGRLSQNELHDPAMALKIFERNYKEYPEHASAADALFMVGWVYYNELNDPVNARKVYQEFLQKYKDHKFASGARDELKLIEQGGMPQVPVQTPDSTAKVQ